MHEAIYSSGATGCIPCAERMWNMTIPGFGVEEQPHRKSAASEAHKQVCLVNHVLA